MQVTLEEGKNASERRVGVDEALIKFRPSPNFKNMKKFLKSRSEAETTVASPTLSVIPAAELQAASITEKMDNKEVKPVTVAPQPVVAQPPLPPYPPPPDSPVNLTIKQEIVDEDEQTQPNPTLETVVTTVATKEESMSRQNQEQQQRERQKKTICKEFIRGNCNRQVCKYAHEVDTSQLAGVFTFCWDYQNDVCTFPNCRFVHASVFEEGEFYRTGQLPPHARAHMKKQAPPPPPDEPVMATPQAEIHTASFANPLPPQLHPNLELDEFRTTLPRSTSPLKREWGAIDDVNTTLPEMDTGEQMAKKCKNCDIMEFSIKYHKDIMENTLQSSEEMNKKMGLLTKKSNKLYHVLLTIFKSAANKTSVSKGLIGGPDKDNSLTMLEQLNNFVGGNRLSSSGIMDDSLKTLVGGNLNLPGLMAKIICSAGEQALSGDTSREA